MHNAPHDKNSNINALLKQTHTHTCSVSWYVRSHHKSHSYCTRNEEWEPRKENTQKLFVVFILLLLIFAQTALNSGYGIISRSMTHCFTILPSNQQQTPVIEYTISRKLEMRSSSICWDKVIVRLRIINSKYIYLMLNEQQKKSTNPKTKNAKFKTGKKSSPDESGILWTFLLMIATDS